MLERKETYKALDNFGERVTRLAKINLGASQNGRRIDNSGALKKSIDYEVVVSKTGNSFEFSIEMLDYGKYVDKGRKPGKGIPIAVMDSWIKTKPIKLRDLESGQFIKSTKSKLKSLSFLLNRKIKEKGIAATNFISDPFEDEFKKLPDAIVEAFGLDIENFLEFTFNGDLSR